MPTVPDIHRRGTRAAQGTLAAPPLTVGTLYFVTDESVTERWNGTAWEGYSDGGGVLVPGAHASTHQAGGSDPIALDTLAAPTDIATLNASTAQHGLLRKLSGTATEYLDGSGAWSTPAGAGGGANAWLLPFTAPALGSFAWVNQGTATATAVGNRIILVAPAGGGVVENVRLLKLALPAAPYTVTACFVLNLLPLNYHSIGVALRESATGKLAVVAPSYNTGFAMRVYRFTNPTTFGGNPASTTVVPPSPIWLRISRSGTTLTYQWSPDGYDWRTLWTEALTASFTTAPDEAGFCANLTGAADTVSCSLLSWAVT